MKKLPNGWEVKKLGEVSKIMYGYTEKSSLKKIGPKFLRITDIQNNTVNWNSVPYCKILEDDLIKYKLEQGDIVFARTGATTGKSYLIKDSTNAVFASYLIRVKINTKSILPIFLDKYFQTSYYWAEISKGTSGSAQGGFNAKKLSNLNIPIPPLQEQKRIVKILDEAFAAIDKAKANAEKNLANSKELFESYLNGIFSNPGDDWEEKRLGDCFKLKSGDGLTSKMMNMNGEYNVYGGNGVAGKHDKYNLDGINVIIGRVGAQCGIARNIKEKIWLTDNAFKLVDLQFSFDLLFLTYLLNFKNLRNLARQTAQPVISNSSLKDLVLIFPKSMDEQNVITKKLEVMKDEINKLEKVYIEKIHSFDELKRSILKKAFEGEL